MTHSQDPERDREHDSDRHDRRTDRERPARPDGNEAMPEFDRGTDLDRGQQDPVRESER